jgi:hypothetical protein
MSLRLSCKALSYIHTIQFLYIKAYKETVDIYGHKLRNNTRIRLDSKSINDDEFMYIAVIGHSGESSIDRAPYDTSFLNRESLINKV